ncbi:MAG: ATP-dependent 6-phosphofructokinase [Pseudomonadota bacterium]
MYQNKIKKIAISTGGGDAPGLNAVIRAAVLSAINKGWEVVGIRDGYNGLFLPQNYKDIEPIIKLTAHSVRGITNQGGTILGTTNKGNPLCYPTQAEDGSWFEKDITPDLVSKFKDHGIDALISIGGDGSLKIANAFADLGLQVVGVPKTIDNDLDKTVITFGFDSAVSFATSCIDRLHATAQSHHRIMVVEVMGRYAGWIALNAGVSACADVILMPEIPYDLNLVAEKIKNIKESGRDYSIVVVAEGAKPADGNVSVISKELGRLERLGGVGETVAKELEALTGIESRAVILGHLLRGGSPTTFDRLISLRFGAAAVRALSEGQSGIMVALDPPFVRYVPLKDAVNRMKSVPLDCDTVNTARDLGTCFGDS